MVAWGEEWPMGEMKDEGLGEKKEKGRKFH